MASQYPNRGHQSLVRPRHKRLEDAQGWRWKFLQRQNSQDMSVEGEDVRRAETACPQLIPAETCHAVTHPGLLGGPCLLHHLSKGPALAWLMVYGETQHENRSIYFRKLKWQLGQICFSFKLGLLKNTDFLIHINYVIFKNTRTITVV